MGAVSSLKPHRALLASWMIGIGACALQAIWLLQSPRTILVSEEFHAGLILVLGIAWSVATLCAIRQGWRSALLAIASAPFALWSLLYILGLAAACYVGGACI
jgi:hypothetical protein